MALSNSPAEIVQQLLVNLAQGVDPDSTTPTTTNWPVYSGGEPDSPDNCITVYNTQGSALKRKQVDGKWEQAWGLQIRVRGTTNAVAFVKMEAMKEALDTVWLKEVFVGANHYLIQCFTRQGNPIDIYKNMPISKRNIYTLNLLASIDQYPLRG